MFFRNPSRRFGISERALRRLLVEADDVSTRVAKPRRNLWSVSPDGLHDLAAIREACLRSVSHAINHHVEQQSRRGRGWPSKDPRSTHLASRVVKGYAAIAAFADVPAEYFLVEIR